MKMIKPTLVATVLALLSPALTNGQSLTPLQQRVRAAMEMDHRTEAELERDADRDPVAALDFIGLEPDMTVIEFLPAGQAYYAKILGPVLRDEGHHYVVDSQRTFDRWGEWTELDAFTMTHQVPRDGNFGRIAASAEPGEAVFGVTNADLFLHFREYHNFNDEENGHINAKVFEALKPGGTYVVVDHSRRHMQEETQALARRVDPVDVILQVQAAGFVLDRASDMFFEESDDLTQEVGQIPNRTDRFFLVFKKP